VCDVVRFGVDDIAPSGIRGQLRIDVGTADIDDSDMRRRISNVQVAFCGDGGPFVRRRSELDEDRRVVTRRPAGRDPA
jgi:hypothetical protein